MRLAAAVALIAGAAFCATGANYRSTVVVRSDNPDAGEVCITHATTKYLFIYTHTKPADPTDEEYGAEVSASYVSSGGGTKGVQRYYLYAKAKPGYKFVRWEGGSSSVPINTTEPYYEFTWEHYTKDTGSGDGISCSVTAYFVAENAVTVETNIPAGVVTLDPEAPQIGDRVTATSTMRRIATPGTAGNLNMMTEFSHWEDGDGNMLSSDEVFTFEVEKEMTLKAVYRTLGEVPQQGKFYRIRNVWNRVLTLEGGFRQTISGATDVPQTLLRWALPLDHDYSEFWTGAGNNEWSGSDAVDPLCPEASPGTIFYIAEGVSDDSQCTKVSLASQGIDTRTVTGQTLDIVPMSDNFCGYYGVRSSSLSGAGFKTVVREGGNAIINISSFGDTDVYSAMAFQPVDEEHMDSFWFGAAPDGSMLFDGSYWTTMFTAFPYECRDGVRAYYVKEVMTGDGEAYACLTEIADGRVPGGEAVLLRCNSLQSRENRLLPLDPAVNSVPALEGNMLRGSYQLYTDREGNGRRTFDESSMRVFGVNSKGELGFYKLAGGEDGMPAELKANKAYLDMSVLPGGMKAASFGLRFGGSASSGIDDIEAGAVPDNAEDSAVYDLEGRRIVRPVAGDIYIVNGKVTVWN